MIIGVAKELGIGERFQCGNDEKEYTRVLFEEKDTVLYRCVENICATSGDIVYFIPSNEEVVAIY